MYDSMQQQQRPGSGKGNKDQGGKDKIIGMLEQNIMDRLRNTLKDQEAELDKQLRDKMDSQKGEDEIGVQVRTSIKNWSQSNQFKQTGTQIQQSQKIENEPKAKYVKMFNEMHTLMQQMDADKSKIKIKLNVHFQGLVKSTANDLGTLQRALGQLEQAGCCGKGQAKLNFEMEIRKFEMDYLQWSILPKLENNSVDYQVFKPKINYDDFRMFLIKQLRDYFPDGNGETKIVEKIVNVEVPKMVDKVVEKIVYVDKIVEKIVEKKVEVKVPEVREVVREVQRDADRIREGHEMLYGIGRPQNVPEALNIYYEEAEVNLNVIAYNTIAQIFYDGKFFPKDLNKAYTYWEKSAAQQNPEGLYRIGKMMMDRIIDGQALSGGRIQNRDQEVEEAIVYYQHAVEQGHLDALVDLGEIFEVGIQSEESPQLVLIEMQLEQAEFYYMQGKKVRYPRALNALGMFYLQHPDYKETVMGNNARKAIKYFEMARDLGFVKAYFHLAQCYEQGNGVMVNIERAKNFYKEGALRADPDCKSHYMFYIMQDASHSGKHEEYLYCHNYMLDVINHNPELTEAFYYLGHLYECGFGVLKDPNNSIHYYFKGAKLNNASCMTKLGDFYHSGFGVPQNQREALRWYSQAAELKDAEALINMGTIYESGYEGVAIDYAKAFNSYEEAAKLRNANAEFHIGLMYEAGRYVKKDINYAVERYKKAAKMGCQPARDLLAKKQIPMIYDDGVNTTMQDMDGDDLHARMANDKQGLMGSREPLPMITNPIVAHVGKKTNQSILASKQSKIEMNEGKMVSILTQQAGTNMQSHYVQSQVSKGGFHHQP